MTIPLPLNLRGLSAKDASKLVLDAVAQGDGLCLEFKRSFQKEVIESLTAFANTQGGSILMGISDSGKVVGADIEAETTQSWINQCKQITSPSVIPDVDLVGVDGKTVAVVSVGEYPVKPVACKGRHFKRVGNANHQMSATEISDAHIKLINSSWDYYPDPEHAIDSISESKVQAFAEAIGMSPNNPLGREPVIPAKAGIQQSQNAFCLTPLDSGLRRNDGADGQSGMKESFQGVLEKFELIKQGRPTFACHLLFSKNDVFLSTIEAGRFASETIIKDSITSRDTLIEQVERIMGYIVKHTNKACIITGNPRREERWDYPMEATREIVINMIVHRDYRSSNDSTIKIFDDRIEFFNPGKLLDDLTVEKIKTGRYKSYLRNKQLASIFKELELIEKYGSGVRRVIDAFVAYGLPDPVFEMTQGGMAVTVFKEISPPKVGDDAEGVSGGVSALLAHLQANPGKRAGELVEPLDTSLRTIERWLKQLKEKDLIEFRGAPKTGGYYLKANK